MSFFSKFKSGNAASSSAASAAQAKKELAASQQTALEKHIADITSLPVRTDGSDKFFGYENYGSTCYCNSIIQCLYYSAPFREHVLNFPGPAAIDDDPSLVPVLTSTTPYPNPTSPARKVIPPTSPTSPNAAAALSSTLGAQPENKDSPEARKRAALAAGPVLGLTHSSAAGYGLEESLFSALRDLFAAIIAAPARIGVVSPHRFLELLRRDNEMFRSAMHQDAHEFLNFLLNAVVDEVELILRKSKSGAAGKSSENSGAHIAEVLQESAAGQNGALTAPSTANTAGRSPTTIVPDARWVHDLFEGRLTSETRCLTCETVSQRDEPFLDLSVDLSPHTSVTACLRKFSEEEMLCERNKFHCDTCGGLQEAEKRMKIKRLPKVLALHLKRFKYTDLSPGEGGLSNGAFAAYTQPRLHKLFHRVVYPFHLRLFDTTDDAEDADRLYELYAVVVHIGGGPYHGHYVSIVKTQDRGWLLFDDELVEPVDPSYVLNFFGGEPVPGNSDPRQLACAYVLFYQETTLEAVLREEDAQANPPTRTEAAAATELRASADLVAQAKQQMHAGQSSVYTARTPAADDALLDPLAHTLSAPAVSHLPEIDPFVAARPGLSHLATSPALAVTKTRGEMRQAEKERRAEEKAQRKVEADRETDAGRPPKPVEEKEGGGLARFRPASMSIRGKSRLFGGSKEKEKELAGGDKDREPTVASGLYGSPPANGTGFGATSSTNTASVAGSSTTGTGSTSSLTNGASLASSSLRTELLSSSTADVSSSLPFSPLLATPTPPAEAPSTSSSNQYFNEHASSPGQKPSLTARKSSMRRNPFSSFGRDKDKPQPLPPAPTSAPRADLDSFSRSLPSRSGLSSSNGTAVPSTSINGNSAASHPGRPDLSRLTSEAASALPTISAPSPALHALVEEKEKKRNRFSLGRKKSSAFT